MFSLYRFQLKSSVCHLSAEMQSRGISPDWRGKDSFELAGIEKWSCLSSNGPLNVLLIILVQQQFRFKMWECNGLEECRRTQHYNFGAKTFSLELWSWQFCTDLLSWVKMPHLHAMPPSTTLAFAKLGILSGILLATVSMQCCENLHWAKTPKIEFHEMTSSSQVSTTLLCCSPPS